MLDRRHRGILRRRRARDGEQCLAGRVGDEMQMEIGAACRHLRKAKAVKFWGQNPGLPRDVGTAWLAPPQLSTMHPILITIGPMGGLCAYVDGVLGLRERAPLQPWRSASDRPCGGSRA